MAFDLFDLDHGGSIDPKGIFVFLCRIKVSNTFTWNWGQSCCSLSDDSWIRFGWKWTNIVRLVLRDDDPQTKWAIIEVVDSQDICDVRS